MGVNEYANTVTNVCINCVKPIIILYLMKCCHANAS